LNGRERTAYAGVVRYLKLAVKRYIKVYPKEYFFTVEIEVHF
jgi:hypothetical protein